MPRLRKIENLDSLTLPLCRACLQQCSEQYSSLYDSIQDAPIHEHITSLVDIKISENDGYPQAICRCCLQDLQVAISFRQRCINTNSSLGDSEVLTGLETLSPVIKEEIEQEHDDDKYETIYEDDEHTSEVQIRIDTSQLQLFNKAHNAKSHKSTFECHDCGEVFKSKFKLQMHWKKIHLPQEYKCHKCKRIFKNSLSLNRHLEEIKKKVCVNLQDMTVEGEGKGRTFRCKTCDYSTKVGYYIRKHVLIHSSVRMYPCDMCDKSFKQHTSLYIHRKYTHKLCNEEFSCHMCGKVYVGKLNLRRHILTNHGNKFQCDICKKEFKSKYTITMHMKRHTGNKTYKCKICSKTFYTLGEKIGHIQNVHEKKLYHCKFCDYKCHKSVKRHQMMHTDNNVACKVCGRFFESQRYLDKHAEVHGDKKFSCHICNHKFLRKDSIRYHMATKHK